MKTLLLMLLVFGGYFFMQLYLLPKLGIST
jgi:hypothetical protein